MILSKSYNKLDLLLLVFDMIIRIAKTSKDLRYGYKHLVGDAIKKVERKMK